MDCLLGYLLIPAMRPTFNAAPKPNEMSGGRSPFPDAPPGSEAILQRLCHGDFLQCWQACGIALVGGKSRYIEGLHQWREGAKYAICREFFPSFDISHGFVFAL
ncbi:MAG TPA: hypothetical protein VLA64_02195 [Azonexus sp.]|nr:hypothetical protein [Azonexus sp.]